MTVKRYRAVASAAISLSDSGEYVKYEDYAALQAQVNALAAKNSALKNFFDYAWSIAVEACDFDGWDIQEKALELGLIERVTYEAEKHRDKVNDASLFTDGDDVYFPTEAPATDSAIREIKAQGVDESVYFMQTQLCITLDDCYSALDEFAATLRNGEQGGDHA